MDLDAARRFLTTHHHGILASTRRDGRPQLSPVLVAVDADGRAIISTRATAVKVHNLKRDPYASIAVFSDGFFGDWIQVEGPAEILELPAALEPLVDYYRSVSGEHADWEEYREAMRTQRRVLVRVTLEKAGPDRHG